MKLRKSWILSLGLAAAALGATASRALANEVYKGTFTLAAEAYWGDILLQPGEYTIRMDTDLVRTPILKLEGNGIRAMIIALPAIRETLNPRSHLTLAQYAGGYAVRDLDAGPMGRTYHFFVSKRVRQGTERAAAGQPLQVPVATANGQ